MPDHGSVLGPGQPLAPANPQAVRHGVAIVPQELASIEDMTVYENLFVGRELRRGPFLNRRAMIARLGRRFRRSTCDLAHRHGWAAFRSVCGRSWRSSRPPARVRTSSCSTSPRRPSPSARSKACTRRAPSARARRRDGLHHAQDGRDPRHRGSGRGAARRRPGHGRVGGRRSRGRHRHRDDRPRTGRPFPRRVDRPPRTVWRSAICTSTAPPSRCRSR